MSLADIVPAGVKLSTEEADALLELAYLTAAADGRLADEEFTAFKSIVARVRGTPARAPEITALLDRFAKNVAHEEIAERVQKIAPKLSEALRPVAFKLSVGLGLADMDASDDETEMQSVLAEALGFDDARVEELTAEVYATLDGGED